MMRESAQHYLLEGKKIAISGDNKLIASSTDNKTIEIYSPDAASDRVHESQRLCTIGGSDAHTLSLDLNKDGSILAIGTYDKSVAIWGLSNIQTPTVLHWLSGHTDRVTAVKFSPDGLKVASTSTDKKIIIWSVQTGERLLTFTCHESEVLCLAWSSDGRLIFSGGASGRAKSGSLLVWDAVSGTQVVKPLEGHKRIVACVAFDSKTSFVASGGDNIVVWRLKARLTGKAASGKPGKAVSGSGGGKSVKKRDKDADVSSAASGSRVENSDSGMLQTPAVAEIMEAVVMCRLGAGRNFVASIAVSPDDRYLVSSSERGCTVAVWEIAIGQQVRVLEGSWSLVHSVAWSPDGEYIAVASTNRELRLWRTSQVRYMSRCIYIHTYRFEFINVQVYMHT
jgi:WD40 repeat protein